MLLMYIWFKCNKYFGYHVDTLLVSCIQVLKVLSIGGASLVDAYHWWNMKIQHFDELC